MEHIIHDLKTERQNVSSGLPQAFKLVPVAFYILATVSVLLSLYFYLSVKSYEATEEEMNNRLSEATSQEATTLSKQQAIVDEAKRADGIAKWLEACLPLQPVAVNVGRSMRKDSTIAELSLVRNPEIPAHTLMQLKVDGGGSQQIETTLNAVYGLNYLTYSAQQVKGHNRTDFQATLIYNNK